MSPKLPVESKPGVRVAVIDSGVSIPHPHIGPVVGGASVDLDGHLAEGDYGDMLGHGTAVMAAIQEKAPDAEYYAVRVFGRSLRTSATALRVALEWCLEQRMDVVNLSLGTTNAAHEALFRALVEKSVVAGMLVVAARANGSEPCFPGCLPGVFGIDMDAACPRDRYRFEEGSFVTSPYPRPVPGVPPERNLQGISFAVANACGFVIRARQTAGRAEGVRELLAAQCQFSISSKLA